jgi:hypothetical protein
MNTEISEASIYVGCGRIAVFTVKDNCYVTLKFRDDQKGVAPMDINKTPDLLVRALHEFKKINENFKPTCLLYQGPDFAVYYFERIL